MGEHTGRAVAVVDAQLIANSFHPWHAAGQRRGFIFGKAGAGGGATVEINQRCSGKWCIGWNSG
jgi:hypothetical protein